MKRRWNRRRTATRAFVAALATLTIFAAYGHAQAGREARSLANVGFGRAVQDQDVRLLMQRYNLRPEALFMWTSGLTGTHRTYKGPNASSDPFDKARSKSIETFQKSLTSNTDRVKRFVADHSAEEVEADPTLTSEARSILNIRSSLEQALAIAQRGQPMIYSIEVIGDPKDLERLRRDGMVKSYEGGRERDGRAVAPNTPKPPEYEKEVRDPNLERATGRELYERMQQIAQGG